MSLKDFPRPSVAVDTAALTVSGGRLCVGLLVDHRSGTRRLPGTFLREGELLHDAVRRSLLEKAQVTGVEPVQLHVFDAVDRDSRGRVLSVAHLAVVKPGSLGSLSPVPVNDSIGLDFDHDAIVSFAVSRLREDYEGSPDPSGLLPAEFTMAELREVHETVRGSRLQPDTFRRRMLPHLSDTGELQRGSVGKPALLFRRKHYLP